MNSRFLVVETCLNRAEFRWKWLRFVQQSALLGTLLSLVALCFGAAILSGLVASKSLAIAFLTVLGAVGFMSWAVLIIRIMAGSPNRSWLAKAVEGVERRVPGRFHT